MSGPLFKWAGGKALQADEIDAVFGPCSGTYYEPFLGGGAVAWARLARGTVERARLGDVNPRVIATYVAVRDDPDGVADALDLIGPNVTSEKYAAIRDRFNRAYPSGAVFAAMFLWINRACFNGLYRENASRDFNVPVGSADTVDLALIKDKIAQIRPLLRPWGVYLIPEVFEYPIMAAGLRDQVYCDPPYVPLTETASFTAYTGAGFGAAEHEHLATCARAAVERGATVVLSNHDVPFVRRLYEGFELRPREARRAISREGSTRAPAPELLIIGRPGEIQ